MKTFEQLTAEQRKRAFALAIKEVATELAMGRLEFDTSTAKGKSANKVLGLVMHEAQQNGHGKEWIKLSIAKRLKSQVSGIAIAVAEESLYSETTEIVHKELA